MSKPGIDPRRRRLSAAGLAVLAAGMTHGVFAANAAVTGDQSCARRVARLFRSGRGLARVGAETLARGLVPRDLARILEALASDGAVSVAQLRTFTDEELRSWLRQRQRDDYAHTRVVRVRGWLLSVTETRLCALCALVRHAAP